MSEASVRALDHAKAFVQRIAADKCIKSPSLYFDRQAIEHNIDAMIQRVKDPARWQPHIKTHKCGEIVQLCLERKIRHFKCATLYELELIALVAARDACSVEILCAYPFYEAQWTDARRLEQAHPRASITWLIDSPEHFDHLTTHPASSGASLKLALDVDTGMHRSGAAPERWTPFLQTRAPELRNSVHSIHLLHGYEGHLSWSEEKLAHEGYDALLKLHQLCETLGFSPELLSSGSHSYAHALKHPGLARLGAKARVSPGTILLNDLHSKGATDDLALHYGALVASRVISVSGPRITLDAGSKALSPDVQNEIAAIVGYPQWTSKFQHEEHLVMECEGQAASPKLGEIVWLIPSHVCTTVNLYQSARLIGPDNQAKTVSIACGHRWAEGREE